MVLMRERSPLDVFRNASRTPLLSGKRARVKQGTRFRVAAIDSVSVAVWADSLLASHRTVWVDKPLKRVADGLKRGRATLVPGVSGRTARSTLWKLFEQRAVKSRRPKSEEAVAFVLN